MLPRILYLSYDGILEPLGQSQVLSYLEQLAKNNTIILISFEKQENWQHVEQRNKVQAQAAACGLVWRPLRYHKRFSVVATSFDILQGLAFSLWLVRYYNIQIIHARSYVASVIALLLKKLCRIHYVFDMRGFWADERVDGGLWPANGSLYRLAQWFERQFLLHADCVVSLTQAAVTEMRSFPYLQGRLPWFECINTCTNLEQFQPATTNQARPFTLGYVGSVGVWYLFDEVLRCFQLLHARLPTARLQILNCGGHEYIRERMAALQIDPALVHIKAVAHAEVAQYMQQMDAGIFFIKPVYSKKASAPTKLGEFLGCGVPCLSNSGVGDLAALFADEQVGVVLEQFGEPEMHEALSKLLQLTQQPDIKVRCRQVALRYFALDDGVARYQHIYDQLASKPA
ncbi:glycosyltransferase [Candidatus Electronema sp. PJ]|uniref:glycosyltransferase n=1 Tax=Candidatus Electronema sp. PJ TaxID=3401572 RepID=UPI003AA86B9C